LLFGCLNGHLCWVSWSRAPYATILV
jgi:hypothetical protein